MLYFKKISGRDLNLRRNENVPTELTKTTFYAFVIRKNLPPIWKSSAGAETGF